MQGCVTWIAHARSRFMRRMFFLANDSLRYSLSLSCDDKLDKRHVQHRRNRDACRGHDEMSRRPEERNAPTRSP